MVSDWCSWKALLLVGGLLHYIVWVVTLVLSCTGDVATTSTTATTTSTFTASPSSSSTSSLGLFFPLDVYAWSVGQTLSTLGIARTLSQVLTRKAWDSFEQRSGYHPYGKPNTTTAITANSTTSGLPPLEIPILHVQDFWPSMDGNDEPNDTQDRTPQDALEAAAASKARIFLEQTYGRDWQETPLLLKGLWTLDELSSSNRRRQLTPEGLLQMTDLEIPYFRDATRVGALQPDAHASVADIVRGMLLENRPHKIGSQLVVQSRPHLMEEVAPLGFLKGLLGDHFSPNHLMGNPHRQGWRSWGPGTTTVPLFVANTSPIPPSAPSHSKEGDCSRQEETEPASCASPESATTQKPFTGLHCEPIANVAVQLWGSRTWTLVDPHHSWKLRVGISPDGRSFYPSHLDAPTLAERIPRYELTTTPGDALWLPTWTYHKVDYVYPSNETTSSSTTTSSTIDKDEDEDAQLELHQGQLSIGASLFHFRPVDFFRRNFLFAVLLIPALVKELAGISTQ